MSESEKIISNISAFYDNWMIKNPLNTYWVYDDISGGKIYMIKLESISTHKKNFEISFSVFYNRLSGSRDRSTFLFSFSDVDNIGNILQEKILSTIHGKVYQSLQRNNRLKTIGI